MDIDPDSCVDSKSKKRDAKRARVCSNMASGPSDLVGMLEAPLSCCDCLAAVAASNSEIEENVRSKLRGCVALTSSYSGMGTDHAAWFLV